MHGVGVDDIAVDIDAAGYIRFACAGCDEHTLGLAALVIGHNIVVIGYPNRIEQVGVGRFAVVADAGFLADGQLKGIGADGDALKSDGVALAEERVLADYLLLCIGVFGEGIICGYNDWVCVAVWILNAVGLLHFGDSFSYGAALLHYIPEYRFVQIVAAEGYALRVAVDDLNACTQQSVCGSAVAVYHHGFAYGHPDDGV